MKPSFSSQDRQSSLNSFGWFKACRTNEAIELIKFNPNAFILAYIIAWRARYTDGFNADGLTRGEAMLGDIGSYRMSAREYRTAKQQLEKWGFATFRKTNRGTIGKLLGTRLFDPTNELANHQNDKQESIGGQSGIKQATTNNNEEEGNNDKNGGKPSLSTAEKISKERELERASGELAKLGELSDYHRESPSWMRIKELRPRIKILRAELGVVA